MPQPDFYFNPFDADFRANPYPHFPALLDGPPRQLQLFMPTTLIARYDDVVTVLHDHAQFKQWSNDLISSFGQEMATGPSAAGLTAKDELRRYLAEAIKQRSANPADDLISALVTARDESDALSENELLAFVVLLLLAGNETTTNLIGNGLLALS